MQGLNHDLWEALVDAVIFRDFAEDVGEPLTTLTESAAVRKVIKRADASRSARRIQSNSSVSGFGSVSECLDGYGFVR